MSLTGDKRAYGRAERRRKAVGELLDGLEADGYPGLVKTVFMMIGQNQPSIECFREAEDGFASAADAEQFWDAALDFAACLKDAKLDPDPPEPPHHRHFPRRRRLLLHPTGETPWPMSCSRRSSCVCGDEGARRAA